LELLVGAVCGYAARPLATAGSGIFWISANGGFVLAYSSWAVWARRREGSVLAGIGVALATMFGLLVCVAVIFVMGAIAYSRGD
jgi:hypothetical protein